MELTSGLKQKLNYKFQERKPLRSWILTCIFHTSIIGLRKFILLSFPTSMLFFVFFHYCNASVTHFWIDLPYNNLSYVKQRRQVY